MGPSYRSQDQAVILTIVDLLSPSVAVAVNVTSANGAPSRLAYQSKSSGAKVTEHVRAGRRIVPQPPPTASTSVESVALAVSVAVSELDRPSTVTVTWW